MQLLEALKDFQNMADFGFQFDCLYIEISKAFDKMSVSLLLENVKSMSQAVEFQHALQIT